MKKIISIIYLLFFVMTLYSQSSKLKVSTSINDCGAMGLDTVCGRDTFYRFVYFDFRDVELSEIPELISIIDSNELTVSFCYRNHYSSYLPNVYIGECAAKYIEKIINPKFRYNRITKNGKYYALTLEDMAIIKGLYEKWWEQKKNDPKYHKSALKGSIYKWERCPRPRRMGLLMYMQYRKWK